MNRTLTPPEQVLPVGQVDLCAEPPRVAASASLDMGLNVGGGGGGGAPGEVTPSVGDDPGGEPLGLGVGDFEGLAEAEELG
jgi:hypothetical protein